MGGRRQTQEYTVTDQQPATPSDPDQSQTLTSPQATRQYRGWPGSLSLSQIQTEENLASLQEHSLPRQQTEYKMEPFTTEDGKEENSESPEEGKKEEEKVSEFLQKFTQDTSIHGVKRSFDCSKSYVYRAIWGLLGLTAVGSLLKMLCDLYNSYMKFQVQTVIMVTPTDYLYFPAVTICNLNGMELSKLQAQDTPTMNVSSAIIALSLLTSMFRDHINDTFEVVEKNFPPELLDKTFQDVSKSAFADLNSTMVACFWEGQEEKCEDMFQPVDLDMRRCFQFNGRTDVARRTSHSGGLTSGLQVLVNVRQQEYIYNEVMAVGAQIILHEPGEMPDITKKGFLVSPGASIMCRTLVKKFYYLSEPFKAYGKEDCVTDMDVSESSREKANITVYTSALCRRQCVNALAQDTCGCRLSDASIPYNASLPLCTVRDVYTCYLDAFANISHKTQSSMCPCQRRCQHTEYEVSMSAAFFPSDVALNILQDLNLLEDELARKNVFSLKIFFDDLVSHEVHHVPQYTVENIIGTIGGQMGLFIGASLLSLAEVGYLLLVVGYRGARALWYKIPRHSAVRAKR